MLIKQTNNLRGLIQIPILIAIIAGILIVGGAGYLGVKQYQNYQAEKVGREKIAQEKEKQAQVLVEAQQKSLDEAKSQIEKLKEQSAESKKGQEVLDKKVQNVQKSQSTQQKNSEQNQQITAFELAPYLTGIVKIACGNAWGSGTLWNFSEKYSNGNLRYLVLTNHHVIDNQRRDGTCVVDIRQVDNLTFAGIYIVIPSGESIRTFNNDTDVALLDLVDYPDIGNDPDFTQLLSNIKSVTPKNALNYKISNLSKCEPAMPIGSPVVIIGYPASSQTNEGYGVRTVTNGIISAYDSSVKKPMGNLPYENYFVSAKIDSGNSGGIALSKSKNGLCVLGIPTWLTVGNYETQGLIQNINNVFYKQ